MNTLALVTANDHVGVNVVALIVLVALFTLVTVMGFMASKWRHAGMESLDEWGLGGRSFGTWVTWFLLGGDLYTAYTFIAVPAAMFALGSVNGFFAVPYTIVLYPIIFIFMSRLWSVSHRHGFVTTSDFVGNRYGSRSLSLVSPSPASWPRCPTSRCSSSASRRSWRSSDSAAQATSSPRTCHCSSRSPSLPPTRTHRACGHRQSSPSSKMG